MRLLALVIALSAVAVLVFHAPTVRAQETTPVREAPISPRLQAKLGAAALGGVVVATALSAGVGALGAYSYRCGRCDGEDDRLLRGIRGGIAAGLSEVIAAPLFATLAQRWVGTRHGYSARFAPVFFGSLLGVAMGAAAGELLFMTAFDKSKPHERLAKELAVTVPVGLLVAAASATFFYRLSAHRTQLTPTVERTAQGGWLAGISSRF